MMVNAAVAIPAIGAEPGVEHALHRHADALLAGAWTWHIAPGRKATANAPAAKLRMRSASAMAARLCEVRVFKPATVIKPGQLHANGLFAFEDVSNAWSKPGFEPDGQAEPQTPLTEAIFSRFPQCFQDVVPFRRARFPRWRNLKLDFCLFGRAPRRYHLQPPRLVACIFFNALKEPYRPLRVFWAPP